MTRATDTFRAARDLLLRHREDYESARREFAWPDLPEFNWALDWFDVLAAEQPDVPALWIVHADGSEDRPTYAELSARSAQVAAWLQREGVDRGDRLLLVLGNVVPLWEVMLAAIKLGVVVIPATTLLGPRDLADRVERGGVRHVVTSSLDTAKFADVPGDWTRIAVGPPVPGWLRYADSYDLLETFTPEVATRSPASTWLRTGASAAWSSGSCPRRSRARSAGSSCAAPSRRGPGVTARGGSSARRTSPTSRADPATYRPRSASWRSAFRTVRDGQPSGTLPVSRDAG